MRRFALIVLIALLPTGVGAAELKFDSAALCKWQHDNNGMDAAECIKLEAEGEASAKELGPKADKARVADCAKEATEFAADSGFASYAVYAGCLTNGPGSF